MTDTATKTGATMVAGDALADVLKTIRLNANTYFCSDFKPPWGFDVDQGSQGMFHVVIEGTCWLKLENAQEPMLLNTGDIVAFPTGGAHWISDRKDSPRISGAAVVAGVLSGSNPFPSENHELAVNTLLCGSFDYDTSVNHPFLKELPCFIHLKAAEASEMEWLSPLITILSRESRSPSPGSTVLIDRLTEVLFIQLMRAFMEQDPKNMRYMSALGDSQIGSALNLIHAEENSHWTVERLGEAVALSRTAFTEKFSKLVGMPPKTYLVNWRMQKARTQLETGNMPMIVIAESSGYSSEAAFSKAFKQFFHTPPGQVRKHYSGRRQAIPEQV